MTPLETLKAARDLNIIPPTMRARHHETGEWHVLRLDSEGWWWTSQNFVECYFVDQDEDSYWADLNDFDRFEGVV
ncbi:MAG: hypothetical protein CFE27_14735 [Alphaproteobacteria bacterium PA1]|nr:MAG: hypothetical protein CFE27_14735 [Alphaproteobacteria bacterium PA1]